jgi:carboxyl-terminal processing protease
MIGDIGYLRLLTFTPMTLERTRDAINDFRSKGYKGIILDLRNNYGGLLSAAVGICNLFFEGGVVVSTRSRIASENQVFHARGRAAVASDIPIVVLINRGSASASEIVAGALKDHGRAYLVGERTFGKGSVQQVYPLGNAGFKITTALYYTPSNASIDRIGIPPDREVRFPDFSEADVIMLNSLLNSGKIAAFVMANPDATVAELDVFIRTLNREYELDISLLRRLIRSEQNRRSIAPIYDLEYDVQLREAVRILQEEDFNTLIQGTRTLRELQEEALRAEELSIAS